MIGRQGSLFSFSSSCSVERVCFPVREFRSRTGKRERDMASPPSLCLSCRVSSSSMTSCSAAVSSRSGGEGFVHSNRIWTCVSNSVLNSTLVCTRSSALLRGGKEAVAAAAAASVSSNNKYCCGGDSVIGRGLWTTQDGGDSSSSGRSRGGFCNSGKFVVQCVGQSESVSGGQQQQHRKGLVREGHLEDPWVYVASKRGGGTYDVNLAWELLRQDVLYLDWKARHDVSAIVAAHDKVKEPSGFSDKISKVCYFHCCFKYRSRVCVYVCVSFLSNSDFNHQYGLKHPLENMFLEYNFMLRKQYCFAMEFVFSFFLQPLWARNNMRLLCAFETLSKDRDCYCLVNQSCCGDPGSGGSESSCKRPEICGHYAG